MTYRYIDYPFAGGRILSQLADDKILSKIIVCSGFIYKKIASREKSSIKLIADNQSLVCVTDNFCLSFFADRQL